MHRQPVRKSAEAGSAFLCEHANEVPAVCPCGPECYCRIKGSCRHFVANVRPKQVEPVTNDVEIAGFEQRLQINLHDLNNEVAQQASIFQQVAERFVLAESRRDEAECVRDEMKDALKTAEAEAAIEIRTNPNPPVKLTDSSVEALVQTHPKRKVAFQRLMTAQRDLVKANEEMSRYKGLKSSWEMRNFMLKAACDLDISQHGQSTSYNGSVQYQRQREELNDRRQQRKPQ